MILEMVSSKRITPDEALILLNALGEAKPAPDAGPAGAVPATLRATAAGGSVLELEAPGPSAGGDAPGSAPAGRSATPGPSPAGEAGEEGRGAAGAEPGPRAASGQGTGP